MSDKLKATHKLDKIKSIFTSDQKEKLLTQDGRRNLYFDRNRKNFIKFSLDVKTTCFTIQKVHKEEINKKIKEIYGDDANTQEFGFLIVELIANKFEGKPALIDLKIGMNDTILFNALQNRQLMLCYLPINMHNQTLKKSSKNISKLEENINNNKDNEEEICSYKGKSEKDIKVFLSKTVIHYYNNSKKTFSKEKIKVTEKEIYIFAKKDRSFLIKDISNINVLGIEEKENEDFFKNYEIKGEKPKYCIDITGTNNESLLIGRNTYEHFVTLNKAIEWAMINYKNYHSNFVLKNKLTEENAGLLITNKFIAQSCSNLNDFIVNSEKRKILFRDFGEINLANIINNIMEFKSNFQKKKYNEAIIRIKNILEIINEKMQGEELIKYEKIINKERINQIEEINNKIKEICIDDTNINEDENKIKEIEKIININIFDDLFNDIKEEYLIKHFNEKFNLTNEKNNDNDNVNIYNSKIIHTSKLLLGHYFTKIFNINKEEDILYLGGKEVEEICEKFRVRLMEEKLNRHNVLYKK